MHVIPYARRFALPINVARATIRTQIYVNLANKCQREAAEEQVHTTKLNKWDPKISENEEKGRRERWSHSDRKSHFYEPRFTFISKFFAFVRTTIHKYKWNDFSFHPIFHIIFAVDRRKFRLSVNLLSDFLIRIIFFVVVVHVGQWTLETNGAHIRGDLDTFFKIKWHVCGLW